MRVIGGFVVQLALACKATVTLKTERKTPHRDLDEALLTGLETICRAHISYPLIPVPFRHVIISHAYLAAGI